MKIQQDRLIDSLKNDIEIMLNCIQFFRTEKDALLIQPIPGQWSVSQIIEHLNTYGRYYIPAIDRAMASSSLQREAWFNSGALGNYFTNMMRPKNVFEVKNKMKTQKSHAPDNNLQPDKVLNEFEEQQQKLLQLLEVARNKNLNKIRIPISISKLVRLRLGDTFRFLIAHEQRHFIQARNAIKTIGLSTDKFPAVLQVAQQ
ncbi:MAG TPA: DinB family protein [Chitinophagaceae bacterium]|nr:DinB family protein [Chitinophagaceae bacterium]